MTGHAGEQTLAALRPFGVDTMFTLNGGHVWPFYEAALHQRRPDRGHPARADGHVRGRGLRQAHPDPGPRRAHRRARDHQRRLGHHLRPGSTARRSSCSAVGLPRAVGARGRCRSWTTSRSSRRSRSGRPPSLTRRRRRWWCTRRRPSRSTPHRGPVFLDFPLDVFGPAEAELPEPVTVVGADPDPAVGRRRRRPGGRRRTAGVHRRERRLLGRRVGGPGAGGRSAARSLLLQRSRPRLPAGRPRAGFPPHPRAAEEGGRPGRRDRHAARLPPRLRAVRFGPCGPCRRLGRSAGRPRRRADRGRRSEHRAQRSGRARP